LTKTVTTGIVELNPLSGFSYFFRRAAGDVLSWRMCCTLCLQFSGKGQRGQLQSLVIKLCIKSI